MQWGKKRRCNFLQSGNESRQATWQTLKRASPVGVEGDSLQSQPLDAATHSPAFVKQVSTQLTP